MSENNVIRKSVSLSPLVIASIESACKDNGLAFSTQLDQIVREWADTQRLRLLANSVSAGLITPQDAVDQLVDLVFLTQN
jgi:hypothetical protein